MTYLMTFNDYLDSLKPKKTSDLLTSGTIGQIGLKNLAAQRKAILDNWRNSGLLDGLGEKHIKKNIAQLYESKAASLLKETILPPDETPNEF